MQSNLLKLVVDNKPIIVPLAILDHRLILKGTQSVVEALVQWQGLALEDSAWERLRDMKMCPSISLEGKAIPVGEGDLTSLINEGKITNDIEARCEDMLVQEKELDGSHAHDGLSKGVEENLGNGKRLKVKSKWLKDFI